MLQPAHVRGAGTSPTLLPGAAPRATHDPLDPLRRRLLQVVSGGRSAVSAATWTGLTRDEAALERAQLGTASQLLRTLRTAVSQAGSADVRREHLARAWLLGWTYLGAATARLQRLSWTDPTW